MRVTLPGDGRALLLLFSLADGGVEARGCVVLHMELWGLQSLPGSTLGIGKTRIHMIGSLFLRNSDLCGHRCVNSNEKC